MLPRLLTATGRAGRRDRLSALLDAPAVERIMSAAEALVLACDVGDEGAGAAAAALRAGGATYERATDGTLIVAATRAQLLIAAQSADAEGGSLPRALLEAFDRAIDPAPAIRLRERVLDLRDEARVMGIINMTPNSFYERAASVVEAVARTETMLAAGAAIVDIGGQSYASWNAPVAADEERERVVPAVEALRAGGVDLAISIDTFKAAVAEAALAAGAHLINDCSGLSDPAMAGVVAHYDAALVVMHLRGELNVRDTSAYVYGDALKEIVEFLYERTEAACAAGVRRDAIIVDPGLEFGKEPATDLEILDRFGELRSLGYPILFASSRKSFIGRIFNRPAKELLVPSLATAGLGIAAGARLLRVHDVAETVQLARMYAAVLPERRASIVPAAEMPGTPVAGNSAAGTAV